MKSVEVTVKPIIKVSMESDSQNLDEIVVVGYGTQRKKDVTSAISKVGGEDLANLAAPSFDTQLAGRAAGVQVTTSSFSSLIQERRSNVNASNVTNIVFIFYEFCFN